MQTLRDKAFVAKIRTVGFNVPSDKKFTRTEILARTGYDSPMGEIVQDKIKFKYIKNGHGDDPIMKGEIQGRARQVQSDRKTKMRDEKINRIKELKTRYKKKYGISD